MDAKDRAKLRYLKRNLVAKELRDPKNRSRVERDRKKYDRKRQPRPGDDE